MFELLVSWDYMVVLENLEKEFIEIFGFFYDKLVEKWVEMLIVKEWILGLSMEEK